MPTDWPLVQSFKGARSKHPFISDIKMGVPIRSFNDDACAQQSVQYPGRRQYVTGIAHLLHTARADNQTPMSNHPRQQAQRMHDPPEFMEWHSLEGESDTPSSAIYITRHPSHAILANTFFREMEAQRTSTVIERPNRPQASDQFRNSSPLSHDDLRQIQAGDFGVDNRTNQPEPFDSHYRPASAPTSLYAREIGLSGTMMSLFNENLIVAEESRPSGNSWSRLPEGEIDQLLAASPVFRWPALAGVVDEGRFSR
jgi:hypothetical protein